MSLFNQIKIMRKDEDLAKIEYDLLTKEELIKLYYTGVWDKDKKRFTKEWKLTQSILNDDKWDLIEEEDSYGNF